MHGNYRKRYQTFLLVLIISILLFNASEEVIAQEKSGSYHQILNEKFEKNIRDIIASTDAVLGLVIKDLVSGETFSHNGDLLFTQASVIKLQILLELFQQANQGKFSLDDLMMLEDKNVVGGSGILQNLTPGKVQMSIRDVAILMIIESDNTATNMIIDLVGMENVNETLKKLGFTQTKLQRKMMDTAAWVADRENISTPNETAHLIEMIYNGKVLDRKSCDEIIEILSIPKSGSIRAKLPAGTTVAHKTGGVGGVINDAGIIYLKNRPFIVTAMVNWLADRDAAREAISEISLQAYNYFDRLANSNSYGHKK